MDLRPPEFFRNCKETDSLDEEAWRDILAVPGKMRSEKERLFLITGGCTAAETKVWNHPAYDIWGLGIQMFVLLTYANDKVCNEFKSGLGVSAWGNPVAHKQAVLDGEPPSLKDLNYSEEFKTLVSSMLTKDPKKRPTVSELLSTPLMKKYTELRKEM